VLGEKHGDTIASLATLQGEMKMRRLNVWRVSERGRRIVLFVVAIMIA